MRSLALLLFLYFAVPGSGQLVWDGLPFSTRTEFASLIVLVVLFLSSEFRRAFADTLSRIRFSGLFKPLLLLLCLTKLLTFAWSPLSAGFGACYRSIYEPLSDTKACEKSFESPFIQGHGSETARISRVDSVVDFGAHRYDWQLPFMNESLRFPVLWIERFPFNASYEARVNNPTNHTSYLPIRAIGGLAVRLNNRVVLRKTNYDRDFLSVLEVPPGRSIVRIDFQYRDDFESKLPDIPEAPPARGPYAQLKVGNLESPETLIAKSYVLVTGLATTALGSQSLGQIAVRGRDGVPIAFKDLNLLQTSEDDESIARKFNLEIQIPASSLQHSPLEVIVTVAGSERILARIENVANHPFDVRVTHVGVDGIDISAGLSVERNSITALRPGHLTEDPAFLQLLRWLLDLVSLFVIMALATIVGRSMGSRTFKVIAVTLLSWVVIHPIYDLLPRSLGGEQELVLPYLIIAGVLVAIHRSVCRNPIAFLLPISAVIASQKVFEHVYYNHPGEGNPWWGKLIYYWRDSDWYTNHGNARAVFVDSFLRGGESVFYVRTGPRYLLFGLQLLLGENDILIGLISSTVGFMVLGYLVAQFCSRHSSGASRVGAFAVSYIGLILLGDQIITAFAFLVTSEYTTWIGLMGIVGFLLLPRKESRTWVTSSISALAAVLIHFRPNILFVSLALLPLVLLKIDRVKTQEATKQFVWAMVSFSVIVPLSLIHNLYYGGRFVPFTENQAQTVADHKKFFWLEIWSQLGFERALATIWEQTRFIMYWGRPGDPNLSIFFWGTQLLLVLVLVSRLRRGQFLRIQTLAALLPVTYVFPMLSYYLTSYYPRHLVTGGILCLSSALLAWPTSVTGNPTTTN